MSNFQENVLFSIPIYRESEKIFYEYLKSDARKRTDTIIQYGVGKGMDVLKLTKYYQENPIAINRDKLSWNYNRIIGWIDFYCQGIIIKTNLWLMRGKRIRKDYSKIIFDYRGKLSDVVNIEFLSNAQIREAISNYTVLLEKGKTIKLPKGSFIDSFVFLRSIQFLDIIQLVKYINLNKNVHS